uniref:Uncharacterized protein n=1 Tax=Mammaliicoccus phage MSShimriz1 TaxID=3230127 RepID=A0AAU8GS62_9VIRU
MYTILFSRNFIPVEAVLSESGSELGSYLGLRSYLEILPYLCEAT